MQNNNTDKTIVDNLSDDEKKIFASIMSEYYKNNSRTDGEWRLGDIEPQYNPIGAYQVAIVQKEFKENSGEIIPAFAFGKTRGICLSNANLIIQASKYFDKLVEVLKEITECYDDAMNLQVIHNAKNLLQSIEQNNLTNISESTK